MTNNGRNNELILECFNSVGTAQSKGYILQSAQDFLCQFSWKNKGENQ